MCLVRFVEVIQSLAFTAHNLLHCSPVLGTNVLQEGSPVLLDITPQRDALPVTFRPCLVQRDPPAMFGPA